MTRRNLVMLFVSCVLGASLMFQGCGTPVIDGIPVSITPPVVRTNVNGVVSITISLSKSREKEGTLFIVIDDTSVILPASETTEVKVPAGASSVTFALQGIKSGRTNIRARMEDQGELVSAQVVVTNQ